MESPNDSGQSTPDSPRYPRARPLSPAHLVLPVSAELGLRQADLAAAARVDLGAPSVLRSVPGHPVPPELVVVLPGLALAVLPLVLPLPLVLSPVVLGLNRQQADHGQQQTLQHKTMMAPERTALHFYIRLHYMYTLDRTTCIHWTVLHI